MLSLQNRYDLTLDEQRVAFLKEAAQLISSFSTAVEREVYGARAAEAAGITADAMKVEISRAYRRRKAAEQKRQEQQDLDLIGQVQPKERGLRYSNTGSAVAEEVLLTMLLKEPNLLPEAEIPPEMFSSSLLGRAFGLVRQLAAENRPVSLASMTGEFTPEEMNHLTMVVKSRDQLVSDAVVRDCVKKIRDEYEKSLHSGADALLARAAKLKAQKGYGG